MEWYIGNKILEMRNLHLSLTFCILLFACTTYGQKKFKVVVQETGSWQEIFSLVDENGKVIRRLDTSKYFVCFSSEKFLHFAIFGMRAGIDKSPGWAAINAEENILFRVYNTSFGEPSPDYLVENKIRIVDNNNLIGYADNKGKIIIQPQFAVATAFHNGKAIIGNTCRKIPWNAHSNESDCQHYSIICDEYGYINTKGTILKFGTYSFDDIMNEIKWKMPEE